MSSPYHAEAGGIHPAAYWQDTDPTTTVVAPDAVVAKSLWVDTTGGFYRLKVRNDTNTAWVLLGFIGPPPWRTVSATGSMADTDELVFLDPTSASFTFTMIAIASRIGGRPVILVNIADPATSTNVVTLDGNSSELIGPDSTIDLQPGEWSKWIPRLSNRWERIG